MQKPLEQVKTSDGSLTYYNPDVDECYHSRTGAIEEALEKHVKPSGVIDKASEGIVVIADVCFGLGYNTIVAITNIWQAHSDATVQVFAFENDVRILRAIAEVEMPQEYEGVRSKIVELVSGEPFQRQEGQDIYLYEDDRLVITLYVGDVRKTIRQLSREVVDVVFFDPFSPSKQPELWNENFIVAVARTLAPGGVLTTYSCAKLVREHMEFAGLIVEDGPSVGRVSPSTIAKKPLQEEKEEQQEQEEQQEGQQDNQEEQEERQQGKKERAKEDESADGSEKNLSTTKYV